ncbi:MAG: thioredoxin family protein [Planctomycetota bacterium]|nr:thioredoxin family protein [Planctomycetota bacterium]
MTKWMSCVLLAVGAGLVAGCGYDGPGIEIKTPADLQKVTARNPRPTLVVFHKDGCSACARLVPVMQALAKEYDGRVTFTKCMIMDMFFTVTSYDLKARYEVDAMPTVTLLVDGRERAHWVLTYNLADYRRVLNEALGDSSASSQPASQAASQPASQPASGPASAPADTE